MYDPRRERRRQWRTAAVVAAVVVAADVGGWWWVSPRSDVPVPGPDATPAQVVDAYMQALRDRDFDTANAIDARPGSDLSRFSLPLTYVNVTDVSSQVHGDHASVSFVADFEHSDESLIDGQLWALSLTRDGPGGRWVITGEGMG